MLKDVLETRNISSGIYPKSTIKRLIIDSGNYETTHFDHSASLDAV